MKRAAHIDGVTRICCGAKPQCEDCPMLAWHARLENPALVFNPNTGLWMNERTGRSFRTWKEAHDAE